MRRSTVAVAVAVSLVTVASCASSQSADVSGQGESTSPSGRAVPTEDDLLGHWRAVGELEEQLYNAGFSGRSIELSFSQSDERFEWESNDGCNSLAGRFEVSADGEFSTSHVIQSDMACPSVERDVVTVPDVITKASQVRFVDGELRLYEEDSLLATFVRGRGTTETLQVVTEVDLLGRWRAVGVLARELREGLSEPRFLILSFGQRDRQFWWEGADYCNSSVGWFGLDSDGALSTSPGSYTVRYCPSYIREIVTVPEVVMKATQVRLVDGQLRLYEEDSLLAIFVRHSRPRTPTAQQPPGVAESTPIPLSTSSWRPGDDQMQAGIWGQIALSKDGCVYFKTGGVKNDVIWPAGYSADLSADGVLTVRNPSGEPVGHEGTRIDTGGGGFSEDEGGVSDSLLRLLVCEAADESVLVIQDTLPAM